MDQREAYKELTLSSEDKVLKSYSTMKTRYNRMITRIKKLTYAWIAEYDITDLISAQRYWSVLENDLREELDVEIDARWINIQDLMVDIFTFNYLYSLDIEEWERTEQDDDNLTPVLILGLLGVAWAADGLTLEQRMQKRKQQLLDEVHKIILREVAIGVPKDKLWEAVLHEINKPKYRGSTAISDEAQHLANEAVRQAGEQRTDGYVVNEILDYKTCKFCRMMDGKTFPWSEYQVGITAPLFHPRCRGRAMPIRK